MTPMGESCYWTTLESGGRLLVDAHPHVRGCVGVVVCRTLWAIPNAAGLVWLILFLVAYIPKPEIDIGVLCRCCTNMVGLPKMDP